eukprot:NODE_1956_length_1240_cov_11.108312_g1622_i0.p1 GENE.NODE_1956_length_1240_cov_11.108312_g1622_i0~~NODE_1956_length_1240_cov_11.108312_g1622_i0.p1  ORF type:complete len:336 (-),score=58.78 NODE_1956_length_1240_cov_11.108312_g1622_i0:70-1077(-)
MGSSASCMDAVEVVCDPIERCVNWCQDHKHCWTCIVGTMKCGRLAIKIFGFCCFFIAISLISSVTYVYFHVLFPLLFDLTSVFGFLNFLWGTFITFNLFFNYVACVLTKPGKPDASLLTDDQKKQLESGKRSFSKGEGRYFRYCNTCKVPKPPRAHHCHICDECVLKMDHHCPWINGCVGHYNHRYFALFLLYLWIACVWVAGESTLFFFGILQSELGADAQRAKEAHSSLTFAFVICSALTVAIGGFFSWNTYLVVSNQTTIEFHFNRTQQFMAKRTGEMYSNEYDLGLKRNLQVVFGPFKYWIAVIMPSLDKLPFDGVSWPTVNDMDPQEDML